VIYGEEFLMDVFYCALLGKQFLTKNVTKYANCSPPAHAMESEIDKKLHFLKVKDLLRVFDMSERFGTEVNSVKYFLRFSEKHFLRFSETK
jgi:hypothetical protein